MTETTVFLSATDQPVAVRVEVGKADHTVTTDYSRFGSACEVHTWRLSVFLTRQTREDERVEIEVVAGDITTMQTDVVVTAANRSLVGGGGVDGAIHRAAGPELLRALRPLSPCPVGDAVITPAFNLDPPVGHIVHAVGPRYGVDEPAADLLAAAYRAGLARCDEVSAASVAFPSLSTGAYHYPLLEACRISIAALTQARTRVDRCVLVAFDVRTERFWRRALVEQSAR